MINKTKRTRWEATNNTIRQLLIDFYVKSPVFNITQGFLSSLQTCDDPEFNKKSQRLYNENPQPIIPNWIFKQEDTDKINYSTFAMNNIINKLNESMKNPMWAGKWDLTPNSFANLDYRLINTKRPLQEVKKKHNLSYPPLHDRLPLFFDIKIDPKWRPHYKYL